MYNFYDRLSGWMARHINYRSILASRCSYNLHRKLLLFMRVKFITIIITLTFMQAYADVKAQLVTLKFEKATLEQVFERINAQTGYDFLFTSSQLRRAGPVTIDVANAALADVLERIFDSQPLEYSIDNKSVVILPKKSESVEMWVLPQSVGRVIDSLGNPIRNVTVRVKGTPQVAITGEDGEYRLHQVSQDAIVVFTCVGYQSRELKVSQIRGSIQLHEVESQIEEILVNVGYGEIRAKDLTGSVSQITAADLEGAPPHADIASMLQGKSAGVNVMITSGAPGAAVAVQIRGTTSLTGNNQPLWVIDGIPQYNATGGDIATTLYDLNVADVESVDILKDASATAIYGSRAANGVIIVTTKKGKKDQPPSFDLSYNTGVQAQSDDFRMLNTEEFKEVILDAFRNYFYTRGAGVTSGGIALVLDNSQIIPNVEVDYMSAPIFEDAFFDGQTNWWNEMTQNSAESKYDLSIRGGSENSNYFISAGIADHQGIIKGSDRTTVSGRLNFDTRIGDVLKLGVNVSGSSTNHNNKDVMVDRIWNFRPDFPMYDENGQIFDPGYNEENPLTSLRNRNLTKRNVLRPNAFLEYRPIKDLIIRSSISLSYNSSVTDRFNRAGTVYTNHNGQANMALNESSNWVFDNTATWYYDKNDHSLTSLVGFSMERGMTTGFGVGIQNFPDQDIMTNLASGTTLMKPTSNYTTMALVSALSRLNYRYGNRYLATFTFRADGSSRFGPDKRWGYFPSGALAWVVTEESFLKGKNTALSYLKLRSSYGLSGSQVLGNHDWRTLYVAAPYYETPGFAPSQMGNANLRWEQTRSFDVGVDYGFFKDRLTGTIGYYERKTSDIIYSKSIPTSAAFATVKENIATIANRGYEFDINYAIVQNKNTRLAIGFNVAHNESKALDINGFNDELLIYSGSAQAMRIKVGEPLHQWFGFKWSGRYYQSMEEYNLLSVQNPTTGAKIWYQSNLNTVRPGDLRYDDVNGDSIVNNDDRVALGSAQPKFFGGFGPTLRWKNLSIQTQFTFSYGAKRYWYTNSANWYGLGLFLKNYPAYVLDSWKVDNRDAAWPRMAIGMGSSNTFSDFWLSRADFVRLNLIRFSYRIPTNALNVRHLANIEVAASASNLITWTNYNGIDPQGNFNLSNGGIAGTGSDFGTYPSAKSYNFSVRLTLR